MKLIDLHCDTILKIYESESKVGLHQNDFHVDIQKLRKADAAAQFFAIFIDRNDCIRRNVGMWDDFLARYEMLTAQFKQCHQDIALATSVREFDQIASQHKIAAFLTIEEGGILEGQMQRLHQVYEMGVRLITLTWNYPNSIGFPNNLSITDYPNQKLTAFGVEVVREMNNKGMIVDVSHLSDEGFYQVHDISKKPFIASHSNARALCNHPRNLTDDMLKKLGESGGIVGLNFCPPFLNKEAVSSVESLVEHIRYMASKAGMDAIAIGTDFDGISGNLEIQNIGEMDTLLHALKKSGFKDSELEKIWYKNALRIIQEVIG